MAESFGSTPLARVERRSSMRTAIKKSIQELEPSPHPPNLHSVDKTQQAQTTATGQRKRKKVFEDLEAEGMDSIRRKQRRAAKRPKTTKTPPRQKAGSAPSATASGANTTSAQREVPPLEGSDSVVQEPMPQVTDQQRTETGVTSFVGGNVGGDTLSREEVEQTLSGDESSVLSEHDDAEFAGMDNMHRQQTTECPKHTVDRINQPSAVVTSMSIQTADRLANRTLAPSSPILDSEAPKNDPKTTRTEQRIPSLPDPALSVSPGHTIVHPRSENQPRDTAIFSALTDETALLITLTHQTNSQQNYSTGAWTTTSQTQPKAQKGGSKPIALHPYSPASSTTLGRRKPSDQVYVALTETEAETSVSVNSALPTMLHAEELGLVIKLSVPPEAFPSLAAKSAIIKDVHHTRSADGGRDLSTRRSTRKSIARPRFAAVDDETDWDSIVNDVAETSGLDTYGDSNILVASNGKAWGRAKPGLAAVKDTEGRPLKRLKTKSKACNACAKAKRRCVHTQLEMETLAVQPKMVKTSSPASKKPNTGARAIARGYSKPAATKPPPDDAATTPATEKEASAKTAAKPARSDGDTTSPRKRKRNYLSDTTGLATPAPKAKKARTIVTALLTPPNSPPEQNDDLLAHVDTNVLALSKAMTRRQPLSQKPAPIGDPLVWADSRQALCETVPYFKKPQGGCHQNDKHAYAFLFDGVGHCREYMDQDVIIARAGGSMEADSTTGSMLQGKDQTMDDSQVEAVMNDLVMQNPIVIICGNKHEGAPCSMPHRYCVLGWYKPVMVWAEKTAGKRHKTYTTIKYRLERLQSCNAWYAPAQTPPLDHAPDVLPVRLEEAQCRSCHKKYPQIYLESWLCLNPDCADFWKLERGRGEEAPCGKLEYNPAFLLHRTQWQNESEPYSVRVPLPEVGKAIGDNLTKINTRGVCCPVCGRCNPRYLWAGWRCDNDNPNCNWEGLWPQHAPVMPAALHVPWEVTGRGPSLTRNKHESGVHVEVRYTHSYKVYKYTFDGIVGSFIHAVANDRTNGEANGPDKMLWDIQACEMGLERRRFAAEKNSGSKAEKTVAAASTPFGPPTPSSLSAPCPPPAIEGLPASSEMLSSSELLPSTQVPFPLELCASPDVPASSEVPMALAPATEDHVDVDAPTDATPGAMNDVNQGKDHGDFMTAFSMNFGMPYKFVATGASRSFSDAPWPVKAARSRLNWAARELLSGEADFNEELIFAYMEGQKIEYHDEGEEGLGPRIATLSLGGKAKMHMRMKAKHFYGVSKTGVLTAEKPVLGSVQYEARLKHWEELQLLDDKQTYQRRLKEVPKELGLSHTRNGQHKDLVTVTLSHGDIILMDGYDIQKYLEHKVVPEGYLRFALTCRNVLTHHLKEHERPSYVVEPDDYGYDGRNLL
ncbi:hypothetical protein BAUCODRAFT_36249 [Baudoinia panamericana UAMH 10762]|uniref:Uncharacterized protein n=1 Tax=Baudoinia panamericana (strain UAMH 10762) TaxID=717646 RepID=M2N449_BAUPA|nr:uncharacterized protein BAUCODRAFT_36249 [Baudoinia panamericana UAMH 10762]EMC93794.1 hypothetical protein BAUCODRAFT_36249 [Baudoinia panamericana UAMH 10762]